VDRRSNHRHRGEKLGYLDRELGQCRVQHGVHLYRVHTGRAGGEVSLLVSDGSLSNVMDAEVRGRIQQVAAEIAAKYPLDALRARKQEISDAVKNDITSFFSQRGIVITTVGMFGGMTYENVEIQKAIDNTVIAQQLKVVNEAKWEAQQRDNDRVTLEANAIAERARRIAAGEAGAKKIAAAAEAQAIRDVNKVLGEAGRNPLLYELRSLEVERARVERWTGQYPGYLLQTGSANSPNLMLQLPAVVH
jgi:hypothetical protein